MEFDRYQKHHKLYLLGIGCMLICISLVLFTLYLLPYLIWTLNYNVPTWVLDLISYFQESYALSYAQSRGLTGLLLFIPMLISGYISYYVSNSIDNEIYKSELALPEEEEEIQEEVKKNTKESATLGLEIIVLMILVVVGLFIVQWLI